MGIDYEDISKAAFMAFCTTAASKEAKQLVAQLSQLLKQLEQRPRKLSVTHQASFELGVELVVADLLSTLASKHST